MPEEWEESPDWKFDLCFGSNDPCLGHASHVLVKTDAHAGRVIQAIARATKCEIGVWGDVPRVDSTGEIYLGPEDGKIITDFALWKREANQEYALNPEVFGRSYGFRMYISTDVPAGVLEKIYAAQIETEHGHHENNARACEWLDELGWAFIELSDEIDYAIFATSKQNAHLVENASEALRALGVPVGRLTREGGRLVWPDI